MPVPPQLLPLASSARKDAQPGLVIAISPTRDLAPFPFLFPASASPAAVLRKKGSRGTLCSTYIQRLRQGSTSETDAIDRTCLKAKGAQSHRADEGRRKRASAGTQRRCVSAVGPVWGPCGPWICLTLPNGAAAGRIAADSTSRGYGAFGPPSLRYTTTSERYQPGAGRRVPLASICKYTRTMRVPCPGPPLPASRINSQPIPTARNGQLFFVCISAPSRAELPCSRVSKKKVQKEGKRST